MCCLFLRYLQNFFLVNRSTDEDEEEDKDEGDDTLPWPYLPEEIIIDNILPRLPIKGILRCKQVCKAWRHLIEGSDQFAMSKSKASYLLTQLKRSKRQYGICEFDGKDGGCTTTVSHFGGGDTTELYIHSSANGFLFLVDEGISYAKLFICNPITREYTELPPPPPPRYLYVSVLGFGASQVSGQYKIVRISGERLFTDTWCQVYTVGREGRWRSVAVPPDFSYTIFGGRGVYSNGNLHWLISGSGSDSDSMMRCFDLETEVFMDFHVPPHRHGQLSDLDGRLCLCGSSDADAHELVIWFLNNKHGEEERSWTKEFIIKDPPRLFYPLKLFKDDGDILFEVVPPSGHFFYLYSNKTRTVQEYHGKGLRKPATNGAIAYTPTFLSLKTMGIQDSDVRSF